MSIGRQGCGPQPPSGETANWEHEVEDDLNATDDDCEKFYEVQVGLPLGAENYRTGEPLVVVDYFGFDRTHRTAIAKRLLDIEGAQADEVANEPRVLVFDAHGPNGGLHVLDLIAILTVRENNLRVETARSDVTDRVRSSVESALGATVVHLRRVSENPVEAYLDG